MSFYSKFFAESSVSEVFKETIAAFKRLNRFSISICQNKEDKGPEILVHLEALTKKIDKIFLALQKSRLTQNFPQNLQFRRSLKKPLQFLHGLTDFQYQLLCLLCVILLLSYVLFVDNNNFYLVLGITWVVESRGVFNQFLTAQGAKLVVVGLALMMK